MKVDTGYQGAEPSLTHVGEELARLASPPLSVIAFGEAAHSPEFVQPGDPLPICLVFEELTPAVLQPLHEPLRQAWIQARVEPMLVARAEIDRIADAFPLKVLELRDRGRVLHGANPFTAVEVDRRHARLRLEQETRNHLLRMRRQLVLAGSDRGSIRQALGWSVSTLAQELSVLFALHRDGRLSLSELPSAERQRHEMAQRLDIPASLLDELAQFRRTSRSERLVELFSGHLELLDRLVRAVDELEGSTA